MIDLLMWLDWPAIICGLAVFGITKYYGLF